MKVKMITVPKWEYIEGSVWALDSVILSIFLEQELLGVTKVSHQGKEMITEGELSQMEIKDGGKIKLLWDLLELQKGASSAA